MFKNLFERNLNFKKFSRLLQQGSFLRYLKCWTLVCHMSINVFVSTQNKESLIKITKGRGGVRDIWSIDYGEGGYRYLERTVLLIEVRITIIPSASFNRVIFSHLFGQGNIFLIKKYYNDQNQIKIVFTYLPNNK